MRYFLTILEGRSPGEAEPILATEDGRLIRRVGTWIARRLRAERAQDDGDYEAETPAGEGATDGS